MCYDICILLSHCGLREDKVIAENVEGIDIIISGHSHTLMEEPLKIKNTVIHQSGCYGDFLGLLDFEYENGIKSFHGENLRVVEVEADTNILECLKMNKEKAVNNLSKPLYNIEDNLWHDVVEENPMTNLLADSLKDLLKCDIAIVNSGVINGGIKKGEVSKKKLIEISPSPLNPTYVEIQGKDILKALEQSLDADFCMQDGKGSGFRGKYLGRLYVSGVTIHHDGRNIAKVLVNNENAAEGEELCPERWYTVATSDYLQRGTGYASLNNSINEKYHQDYIRDTLRKYLCRNEFVRKAFNDSWIRI